MIRAGRSWVGVVGDSLVAHVPVIDARDWMDGRYLADGFHLSPPGERVASMMAPSVVVGPDGATELVLGSGGSKRIRTALLQGDEVAGLARRGVVEPQSHPPSLGAN